MQKILLISSILLIPISEILNDLIKSCAEGISFNDELLSQKIKYIGNVAIFLAITNAFITWIVILFF